MVLNTRPRSGEYQTVDPALLLAIRLEMDAALNPIKDVLDTITSRLARGDTDLALLKRDQEDIRYRLKMMALEPKGMNPLLSMFLSGALSAVGTATALWLLVGIGGHAAKWGP